MTIDWTAVGAVVTAVMAVGTFWMAKKTAHAVQLQQRQLVYAYAPTFFVEIVYGANGAWPDFRVCNKGCGAAYDAVVLLQLTSNNYTQKIREVAYWPTKHDVQYDQNAPDSVRLETSSMIRQTYTEKSQVMGNAQEQVINMRIIVLYYDHLHERYMAWCLVKVLRNLRTKLCEVKFPKGRVFHVQRVDRKTERRLRRGANGGH